MHGASIFVSKSELGQNRGVASVGVQSSRRKRRAARERRARPFERGGSSRLVCVAHID
jgi:hypothetical protein